MGAQRTAVRVAALTTSAIDPTHEIDEQAGNLWKRDPSPPRNGYRRSTASAEEVAMRAIASVLFVVLALDSAAYAQPGPDTQPGPRAQPAPSAQPPPSPYPPSQPYPPPQPYPAPPYPGQPYPPPPPYPGPPYPPPAGVVPPYQYAPVQLSTDEQDLLNRGEITDGRHVGGILVSLFFGLGIGQAVQGRYGDTGWIFTVGEAGSTVAVVVGLAKTLDSCLDTLESRCGDNSTGQVLLIGGLIGLVVFRVWEVADAIGGPPRHNARVRELRMRLGMPPTGFARRMQPYLAPPLSRDGGATAGLTLRF
jgi:hypothetical protein